MDRDLGQEKEVSWSSAPPGGQEEGGFVPFASQCMSVRHIGMALTAAVIPTLTGSRPRSGSTCHSTFCLEKKILPSSFSKDLDYILMPGPKHFPLEEQENKSVLQYQAPSAAQPRSPHLTTTQGPMP